MAHEPTNVTTITDGRVNLETDLVYQGTRPAISIKPSKGKKWTLFTTTICDGYIPTSVDIEEGKPASWAYYDTERQAQLECLDDIEEQAYQVIAGERDIEDSDLNGQTPTLVLSWIREFKEGIRAWVSIKGKLEPNMCPEEVTPTNDGGFIFNGKQFPCPAEADFR